jgi:hypothetical protein
MISTTGDVSRLCTYDVVANYARVAVAKVVSIAI